MTKAIATRQRSAVPAPLLGLLGLGGLLATVAVVLGGQPPAERADSSPVRWPVADVHALPDGMRRVGPAMAWVGAVLLVLLWLVVLRLAARHRLRSRSVRALAAAWAAPLAVGPPVLSADVYSYLAQGELLRRGLSPYRFGISALGTAPVVAAVDPRWRDVPSPYGPVGLAVSRLAAEIGSGSIVVAVVVLRMVALVAVMLTVSCCARLASGPDRPAVTALVALNPIVMLHLLGGVHLDALMVGLVAAALLLSARSRPLLGLALATAAASVKAPALIVVVVLAGAAVLRGPAGRIRGRRVDGLPALGAVVGGTALACAALVPDGFGWLRTLSTPGRGRTDAAPTSVLADGLSGLVDLPPAGTLVACRLLGLGVAGAAVAYLVGTVRRRDPAVSAGLGQLILALLGPVSYVWYLASPLACLAPRSRGQGRSALVVLSAVASLTSLPSLTTPAFPWPPVLPPAAVRPATMPAASLAAAATVRGSSRQAATPGTATPESFTKPPSVTAMPAASNPSSRPGTAATACRCRG